ncbi:hypothetical protein [Streptomyces sp. TR02-1]|uniref:hypothetical protein n=1 Tax=Streptomyces sp. TR02-1 TaxID=3385977 RepID=UPI0039A17BB9
MPDPQTLALARTQISSDHSDDVRHAFALLMRIDPDTTVSDVTRKLLHLAVTDGHPDGDRPDLLLADAWTQFTTAGMDSFGWGLPGSPASGPEAGAAADALHDFTVATGRSHLGQRDATVTLVAALLNNSLNDGEAHAENDASALLADVLHAFGQVIET